MLALTDGAVAAIRTMTSRPGLAPGTGLRIAPEPDDPASLVLRLADAPEPGDELLDDGGARLFLAPRAARELAGRTLDVRADVSGSVTFHLNGAAAP
ncbi:hypothetical protein GCM10022254_03800 [Actinomadura meridiana]|uniref:Fe-S cluster assembly iron-binding protein IscA n=2 Tax=Actinomadura meridiana TaxID=559626 RepID=A0ABP8BS27_9ACTN